MTLIRTFIAVELPQTIQDAISRETSGLRQHIGRSLVRWVPVQSIHLTLRFLGDTSTNSLDQLQQMLARQAGQFAPMTLTVGGFGVFPNLRQPRVVWIGVQAPPDLAKLQYRIELLAQDAGFEPETRRFSPHLTLGRVSEKISSSEMQALRSALETVQVGELGQVPVTEVHLIRSDLRPGGAVYTRLFSAALGAQD